MSIFPHLPLNDLTGVTLNFEKIEALLASWGMSPSTGPVATVADLDRLHTGGGGGGKEGKEGPIGPTGPEGPKGTTGSTGPEGPKGTTGEYKNTGAWSAKAARTKGDTVTRNGSTFACIKTVTLAEDAEPGTAPTIWEIMAEKGATGPEGKEGPLPTVTAVAAATRSQTLKIPSATFTKITLDSTLFDPGSHMSEGFYKVSAAGYYTVSGIATLSSVKANVTCVVAIFVNEVEKLRGSLVPSPIEGTIGSVVVGILELALNDKVELRVYQESGVEKSLSLGASLNRLNVSRVGEGEKGATGPEGKEGPKGATGLEGKEGPKGEIGTTGLQGLPGGDSYQAEHTNKVGAPAVEMPKGEVRLDSNLVASATKLWLAPEAFIGGTIGTWVESLKPGGYLKLTNEATPIRWALYEITAAAKEDAHKNWEIGLLYVASGGATGLINSTVYLLSYALAGPKGATGPEGKEGSGAAAILEMFEASGTWKKPAGVSTVTVICIGGGGGGGGGAKGKAKTACTGGAGGGGGALSTWTFKASELAAEEPVTVGKGGKGGKGFEAEKAGENGEVGGESKFGSLLVAPGGGAGEGGKITGIGATAGEGATGMNSGGTGGNSNGSGEKGANVALSSFRAGAAGGAAGAGVVAAETASAGGTGAGSVISGTAGGAGGAESTEGSAGKGTGVEKDGLPGTGGGGGGSSKTGAGGKGGAGGKWGAGAGGGGANITAAKLSGEGGKGAEGVILVISR